MVSTNNDIAEQSTSKGCVSNKFIHKEEGKSSTPTPNVEPARVSSYGREIRKPTWVRDYSLNIY